MTELEKITIKAMEKIEQEPCETCGYAEGSKYCIEHCLHEAKANKPFEDAISREAVCEIINDTRDCISVEGYCAIIERLKKLTPVTQKSGKWNEYYTSQKGNNVFNCKECGHTFVVTQGKDNMNYCPNCGRKDEK